MTAKLRPYNNTDTLYLYGLTLIPGITSILMCDMDLLIYFQTSAVSVISSHILPNIWLLSTLGLKLINISKRGLLNKAINVAYAGR